MQQALVNAEEFGRHEKAGEGWALGLLVASSVELGSAGRPARNRSDHADFKVSASGFARRSGSTHDRVLRYFRAWERAADAGLVAHAATLTPEDGRDLEHLPEPPAPAWSNFYDASASGGRPRDSKAPDAVAIIEKRGAAAVLDAMSEDVLDEVRAELHRRDVDAVERGAPIVHRERREAIERTVSDNMSKALGRDPVVAALVRATAALAAVVYEKTDRGVDDIEGFTEALREHRRVFRLLEAQDDQITENDRAFLASLGIAS